MTKANASSSPANLQSASEANSQASRGAPTPKRQAWPRASSSSRDGLPQSPNAIRNLHTTSHSEFQNEIPFQFKDPQSKILLYLHRINTGIVTSRRRYRKPKRPRAGGAGLP